MTKREDKKSKNWFTRFLKNKGLGNKIDRETTGELRNKSRRIFYKIENFTRKVIVSS